LIIRQEQKPRPTPEAVVLGTGMMDGYATFSTASVLTVELVLGRNP
jgi:fluoride ion exporter CrcB/FEX